MVCIPIHIQASVVVTHSPPGAGYLLTDIMKKPVRITKAVIRRICDELAQGRSLRSICDSDPTLPAWSPVLRRISEDDEDGHTFYEMYSRARAIGAEFLMDEMFDLARAPLDNVERHLANAEVQRRRVHIDTLKWVFARMRPWDVRNRRDDVPEENGGVIKLSWGGADETTTAKPSAEIIKLVKGSNDG